MHKQYGFRRLLEQAVTVLDRPDVKVTWQTGSTNLDGLNISGVAAMSQSEVDFAIHEADVVITHAGIGSVLSCLDAGKRAVFVPRRRAHAEHIDDHQAIGAEALSTRQLVWTVEADELTWEDVERASHWKITINEKVDSFQLEE